MKSFVSNQLLSIYIQKNRNITITIWWHTVWHFDRKFQDLRLDGLITILISFSTWTVLACKQIDVIQDKELQLLLRVVMNGFIYFGIAKAAQLKNIGRNQLSVFDKRERQSYRIPANHFFHTRAVSNYQTIAKYAAKEKEIKCTLMLISNKKERQTKPLRYFFRVFQSIQYSHINQRHSMEWGMGQLKKT